MKTLILIFSVGMAIAVNAADLRLSFEKPRKIAAIRVSGQDGGEALFVVYGAFNLMQDEGKTRFKATDCISMIYAKDELSDVMFSVEQEGWYSDKDDQNLFRFAAPLEGIKRIDIFHEEAGTSVYVTTKDERFRIVFGGKLPPKLLKIEEGEMPISKAGIHLVMPEADASPRVLNGKELLKAE